MASKSVSNCGGIKPAQLKPAPALNGSGKKQAPKDGGKKKGK